MRFLVRNLTAAGVRATPDPPWIGRENAMSRRQRALRPKRRWNLEREDLLEARFERRLLRERSKRRVKA